MHNDERVSDKTNEPSASKESTSVTHHSHHVSQTLVSTALVDVSDSQGNLNVCRVLLDNGSQSNYITERFALKLNSQKNPINVKVGGLGLSQTFISKSVNTTIKSRFNKFEKVLEFLIVPQITCKLPSIPVNRNLLKIPQHFKLADPEFDKPADIDLLLGVELFYKLLRPERFTIPGQGAVLQKTHLGWIVAGNIAQNDAVHETSFCHLTINSNISEPDNLTRFWELETVPNKRFLSKEEQACETHFLENTIRNETGRYIVKLPSNNLKNQLGNSYNIAKKRLFYLENKFAKNPTIKKAYSEFLNEYESLNHMSVVKHYDINNEGFFLPYHAILKEDKLTTKIRVVSDGSAKDSNGFSLNDSLMVGPTIQEDIFSIFTRFRTFPFVLTADLTKMNRQILVAPEDSFFQKILWRENPDEPI